MSAIGILYLIGSAAAAAVGSLPGLKCDGDHDTHQCPTVAQRVVGIAVLTVAWPVMIPLFVVHKLRNRR